MNSVNDRSRDIGPFVPGEDDDMLICRCEEITKGEIRKAVHDGMWTCSKLVKGIVARELGISPAELEPATSRVPMRPIEMRIFANEALDEKALDE